MLILEPSVTGIAWTPFRSVTHTIRRCIHGFGNLSQGRVEKSGRLTDPQIHRPGTAGILKYEVVKWIIKNRWLTLIIDWQVRRKSKPFTPFYFVDFEHWNLYGGPNGPSFVPLSCRAQLVTLTLRCPILQINSTETANQPVFLWVFFWTLLCETQNLFKFIQLPGSKPLSLSLSFRFFDSGLAGDRVSFSSMRKAAEAFGNEFPQFNDQERFHLPETRKPVHRPWGTRSDWIPQKCHSRSAKTWRKPWWVWKVAVVSQAWGLPFFFGGVVF